MYPNLTELLEEDPREKKLAQWIQSRFAELRRAVAEMDERVREHTVYDAAARIQVVGSDYPMSLPNDAEIEFRTGEDMKGRITVALNGRRSRLPHDGVNLHAFGVSQQIAITPITTNAVTVKAVKL